jgi:hypothetical protein
MKGQLSQNGGNKKAMARKWAKAPYRKEEKEKNYYYYYYCGGGGGGGDIIFQFQRSQNEC